MNTVNKITQNNKILTPLSDLYNIPNVQEEIYAYDVKRQIFLHINSSFSVHLNIFFVCFKNLQNSFYHLKKSDVL